MLPLLLFLQVNRSPDGGKHFFAQRVGLGDAQILLDLAFEELVFDVKVHLLGDKLFFVVFVLLQSVPRPVVVHPSLSVFINYLLQRLLFLVLVVFQLDGGARYLPLDSRVHDNMVPLGVLRENVYVII